VHCFLKCIELYPENGQEGGIGTTGYGNGFRAFLWRNPSSGLWYCDAKIVNINSRQFNTSATITLNIRTCETKYLTYTLRLFDKEYRLYNFSAPINLGKKIGFFHILDNSNAIDFKIGFGVEDLPLPNITINNVNTSGDLRFINAYCGQDILIKSSNLNARYYNVEFSGFGGSFRTVKYYSSTGDIIIPGSITASFISGTMAELTISTHTVYLAQGFENPQYSNGTKEVSMVSVQYALKSGVGSYLMMR